MENYIVMDTDFFKRKVPVQTERQSRLQTKEKPESRIPTAVRVRNEVTAEVKAGRQVLEEIGMPQLAGELDVLYKSVYKGRFRVAVVGEFNRGKSTFVNRLLGKEIVPEGALPTTSLLTRIYPSDKELLTVLDSNGSCVKQVPVSMEVWDGLKAENFGGREFQGIAMVGVADEWLHRTGIELLDTPGAGDLEKSREKVIGDALLGSDGAVIAMDATHAFSISEQVFIRERLIARKTPFLMMIVTKMDQVDFRQRSDVLRFIKGKLSQMESEYGVEIPCYVPYKVDMPDDAFDGIIGMDQIKAQMEAWLTHPHRREMTEEWILSRALSVMEMAMETLCKKIAIVGEKDEEKRALLVKDKQAELAKAQITWEDLRLQLMERCNECYRLLTDKAEEYKNSITERMQYEAMHTQNPQKWWTEDYPYRMKVELGNMASAIDNMVMRQIHGDMSWFNQVLSNTFRSGADYDRKNIMDKSFFKDYTPGRQPEFEDMYKKRNLARIGTAALTITGAFLLSSVGMFPLIATMGIGTGANMISENTFRKKTEEQKEELKKAIADAVPRIVDDSIQESEKRLRKIYDDVLEEARKNEQLWLQCQNDLLEKAAGNIKDEKLSQLEAQREKVRIQTDRIKAI